MDLCGSPQLLDLLPSLQPLRASLSALLSPSVPYPPRSIHLRATSNASLLEPLLDAILSQAPSEGSQIYSAYHPVQRALPRAVQVDCALVASQKALFSRILNGLSGWGTGKWDDSLQAVLRWDGRQEGYTISTGKGKGRAREEDLADQAETKAARIHWDYKKAKENSTKSGIMVERKDESLSGFLDGLRCVFSLGESEDDDPPEQGYRDRPRFIVLHNAERIASLEQLPVGQSEGTLLACFMRLGELTGKPIVPILVSTQEWLTLRPQRGATEPAVMLDLPPLRQRDFLSFLPAYISPSLPISAAVSDEQRQGLLTSLVDLVHQTFSPYFSSELEDYIYLVEKLWPAWVGKVESGQAQPGDTGRMVGLIRADLQAEISGLAELRPLILPSGNDSSTPSVSRPPSPTKLNGTPTKQPPLPGFAASPNFYSPSVTPSKRAHSSTANSSNASNANTASLAASLPLLSRYILISAFLASSNPSRKDIQMLATEEDDLFGGRKKKKGGGTRKTPQRKKLDVNGVARKGAIPQRLLGPKPFPVERLVAITECILPVEMRPLARSPDMMQQIATLTNLRLLTKTSSAASSAQLVSGAGSGAVSAFDKLEGVKLKCSNALELELVEALGKSVGFKVSERLWEAM